MNRKARREGGDLIRVTDDSKMETKQEKKAMTIEDAEITLEAAKKKLEDLLEEKQKLENDLGLAIKSSEAAQIITRRKSLDDLRDQIFAAEITSWKAEVAFFEGKCDAAKPAITEAEKAWEEARSIRLARQAEEVTLGQVAADHRADLRVWESRIHEIRRRIAARITAETRENSKRAPAPGQPLWQNFKSR